MPPMRTDRLPAAAPGHRSTSDSAGTVGTGAGARPGASRRSARPDQPADPAEPGPRNLAVRWPDRRDLALAAGTGLADLVLFSDLVSRAAAGWSPALVILPMYAALGAVLLAYRRRCPGVVLVLLCVHSALAGLLLTYRPILGVCVALATVAATAVLRRAVLAHLLATAASATWVVNEARTSPRPMEATTRVLVALVYAAVLLVPTGIGRWEHASRRRAGELERSRAEAARLAVLAERRRLARELHDIVAHAVTVMVVQAAGARRVLGTDQRGVDAALAAVQDVGTQAMSELRRLLGVLRTSDGLDQVADVGGPTLVGLTALVTRMQEAGIRVTVEVRGTPGRLDPSVDRTAYRVLQEALTNITKHVGTGAAATVVLTWGPREVVLEVRDDGRGSGGAGDRLSTGHGLLGLAERVAVVEGTLDAGPAGGGFRVAVRLPTAAPLSTTDIAGAGAGPRHVAAGSWEAEQA
jgi:signal transduction histidine kinase